MRKVKSKIGGVTFEVGWGSLVEFVMMMFLSFRGEAGSAGQTQRIMDLICEGVCVVMSAVVKS